MPMENQFQKYFNLLYRPHPIFFEISVVWSFLPWSSAMTLWILPCSHVNIFAQKADSYRYLVYRAKINHQTPTVHRNLSTWVRRICYMVAWCFAKFSRWKGRPCWILQHEEVQRKYDPLRFIRTCWFHYKTVITSCQLQVMKWSKNWRWSYFHLGVNERTCKYQSRRQWVSAQEAETQSICVPRVFKCAVWSCD